MSDRGVEPIVEEEVGVYGDHEWLAIRLASASTETNFDDFLEIAQRLVAHGEQVTAVIHALERNAASQHDEAAIAARRLRLAQYAALWSTRLEDHGLSGRH